MTGVLACALGLWAAVLPWAWTPAAAALAVSGGLVWWPRSRGWLAWLAGGAGTASLTATLGHHVLGWPGLPPWGMVEAAFLCALVGLVARWAPEQRDVAGNGAPAGPGAVAVWGTVAGAVLAGAGAATSVLRAIPTTVSAPLDPADAVFVVAVWTLGPLAAAAVGLFLRYLAERRDREVAWARQAQRMELAHDLHDYVAHDVSAMVAQAQAAGVVIEDREAVLAALARIEASGLAAMASMDRTVGVLRDRSGQERGFAGVAELPELVERFGDTARLTMDPRLADAVPRELAGTVHRVVAESLTNVRRHAPAMTEVEVAVRLVAEDVEVVVRNDSVGVVPAEPGRRGGVGLPALAERVGALSGTFEAGPQGGGWLVRARLPLTVGPGGTGGSYTGGTRGGGQR
ncbi:hypothetical protein GCM10026982_49650 [Nocardiopsis aegyptia]